MTTNPYQAKLERELDDLRTRRVALRKALRNGPMGVPGGDNFDKCRAFDAIAQNLKATDHRWNELHFLLGRELPCGPVKLGVSAAPRAAARPATRSTPMQDALKRRGFDGRGYVTKVMRPER
jgi:hypothetical protein